LKRTGLLACGAVALWYLFAWTLLRPLAEYERAAGGGWS